MKLRIRGNSLRLRLTQTEVRKISEGCRVEETIHFGPSSLKYALEPSREAQQIQAEYGSHLILVRLPWGMAMDWANSTQVSLKVVQKLEQDPEGLFLLIEKDFFCLKPREHESEDESDMFPNPNVAHGKCGGHE